MIGFEPQNLKEFELAKLKIEGGAQIKRLSPGGPAEKAGLKEGDIIVKVADTPIKSQVDLRTSMLVYPAGRVVNVEYLRDNQRKSTPVKLEDFKVLRAAQPTAPTGSQGDGLDLEDLFKNMPNRGEGIPSFPRRRNVPDQSAPQKREGTPRLGISVGDVTSEVKTQFFIPSEAAGAVVMAVEPGSIAEGLGLREGDVITGVKWGDRKTVSYSRYGKNTRSTATMDVEFR
jgi:S1-C subfamily serine protease